MFHKQERAGKGPGSFVRQGSLWCDGKLRIVLLRVPCSPYK